MATDGQGIHSISLAKGRSPGLKFAVADALSKELGSSLLFT